MAKVALMLDFQPSSIEAYIRFKAKAGHFEPKVGFLDTGGSVSLFPLDFLVDIEHRVIDDNVEIEQAGIAGQYFKAIEAEVTIYFEDLQGNVSRHLTVRAWFADTDKVIIGFQDILEHSTFFVDFRQTRTGWIEF